LFEQLTLKPADSILKLIAEHRDDPRAEKVDLGVGVYRDSLGNTPIMRSVKKAEHWLVGSQASKAYLGSRGDAVFCEAIQQMMFGDESVSDGRISTIQSPGGSGALRIAAQVILRANPKATMWVSDPTWDNHVPLLGEAGVNLRSHTYYDTQKNTIRFDGMLEALKESVPGDLILLHGCCHNPTGMDLSIEQWNRIADFVEERKLIPFIDLAYQGFAEGLEEDRYGVKVMYERVPELVVTQSCSKNFGLYRDRVGALSMVAADGPLGAIMDSQVLSAVRTMYSVPPDHGAAVVSKIINDPELKSEWLAELSAIRTRLKQMRKLLVEELYRTAPTKDFSHIERTTGMFCYLGVSSEQVVLLKQDHGVYLLDSGRINVCGITESNVQYLAESIASVI